MEFGSCVMGGFGGEFCEKASRKRIDERVRRKGDE
jgi:hypothetical protein